MDQRPKASDPDKDKLSESTVHDLYASLTVIRGQTQLLQRWVNKNAVPDSDAVVARLDIINRLVTTLATRIDDVHQAGKDDPSDTTGRDQS